MKKLLSMTLVLLLALSLATTAFATGSVTYEGDAREFVFAPGSDESPTDLFEGFKDVMPGDSLTEKILVKNNSEKDVKVKLFMRSLGAQEETNAFLNQMHLTVKQDGDSVLFDAPADQTAGLTEWTCLGTFYAGGEIVLDVTLDVPVTMGNEFADQIGYLDWQFKVEEFPMEPDDPAPDTGDDRPVALYMGVMAVSAVMVVVTLLGRKKKA